MGAHHPQQELSQVSALGQSDVQQSSRVTNLIEAARYKLSSYGSLLGRDCELPTSECPPSGTLPFIFNGTGAGSQGLFSHLALELLRFKHVGKDCAE